MGGMGVLVWFYSREDEVPVFYAMDWTELDDYEEYLTALADGDIKPLLIRIGMDDFYSHNEIERIRISRG